MAYKGGRGIFVCSGRRRLVMLRAIKMDIVYLFWRRAGRQGSGGRVETGATFGRRLGWTMILGLGWLVWAGPTWAGEDWAETYAAQGRMMVVPMAAAPFPHPARAEGHRYQDKLYSAAEHYADSTVAIFIPKGFRETGRIDLVIHFHGWNNTVAGTLGEFKLVEQLVASGKNAVLVVPEGPHDAPDSFGGKLEDPDGFERFVEEVAATLKARGGFKSPDFAVGRIILSGHSGAYHVMIGILQHGGRTVNADEVWLFDALYAGADTFLAWSDRRHGRLLNIYTDHGGTKENSEKMMAGLTQGRVPFFATEEAKLTAESLKANRLVFIHTELAHNDVLEKRKEFERFLETSGLEEIGAGAGGK
jgi:hypothetical protein